MTSYAWAIDGGALLEGPLARSVTFSKPGNHVVTLRVADADGLSSIVSDTIPVSSGEVTLMQPFPVVHVAGSFSRRGTTLQMLSVQAPAGATVVVDCHGGGCPTRRQRRTARGGAGGSATVHFPRFERTLPAGLVLKVRVFEAGKIGKLTRLSIRRGKPPRRSDTCLDPTGAHAMSCP